MNEKLMRVAYKTDADPTDPEYVGAFSVPFPATNPYRRIVAVDWSIPGEVEVTWLIPAE